MQARASGWAARFSSSYRGGDPGPSRVRVLGRAAPIGPARYAAGRAPAPLTVHPHRLSTYLWGVLFSSSATQNCTGSLSRLCRGSSWHTSQSLGLVRFLHLFLLRFAAWFLPWWLGGTASVRGARWARTSALWSPFWRWPLPQCSLSRAWVCPSSLPASVRGSVVRFTALGGQVIPGWAAPGGPYRLVVQALRARSALLVGHQHCRAVVAFFGSGRNRGTSYTVLQALSRHRPVFAVGGVLPYLPAGVRSVAGTVGGVAGVWLLAVGYRPDFGG